MAWDLVFGIYRCINCGGDMISIIKYDDEEPRLVYSETPLACPKCDLFTTMVERLFEDGHPELILRLIDLLDP